MAMACLRLFTFLPLRPLFSLPRLNSCISRLTDCPAFGLYLRRDDFRPRLLLEDERLLEDAERLRELLERFEDPRLVLRCDPRLRPLEDDLRLGECDDERRDEPPREDFFVAAMRI